MAVTEFVGVLYLVIRSPYAVLMATCRLVSHLILHASFTTYHEYTSPVQPESSNFELLCDPHLTS